MKRLILLWVLTGSAWPELYVSEFMEQALDDVALVGADGEPTPCWARTAWPLELFAGVA